MLLKVNRLLMISAYEMKKQRSRSRAAIREKTRVTASSTASWRRTTRTITYKLGLKNSHRKLAQGLIRVDVTCDGR